MHRLAVLAAAALVAVGCAPTPPRPMTAAEISTPHRVVLAAPATDVPVDIDMPFQTATVVPLSPAGILVAAVANVAVAGINASIAQVRMGRRDALRDSLGETGPPAADFVATFDAALDSALRANGALRIAGLARADQGSVPKDPAEATLALERDLVFTPDGRWLVGRAAAFHGGAPGAATQPSDRRYLVFSVPVPGETPEAIVAAWREGEGSALRAQARSVAQELARLVTASQFDPQPVDLERLPRVWFSTGGVGVPAPQGVRGPSNLQRVMSSDFGWLLQRSADRVVLLVQTGAGEHNWVWVSVPVGAVTSGLGS